MSPSQLCFHLGPLFFLSSNSPDSFIYLQLDQICHGNHLYTVPIWACSRDPPKVGDSWDMAQIPKWSPNANRISTILYLSLRNHPAKCQDKSPMQVWQSAKCRWRAETLLKCPESSPQRQTLAVCPIPSGKWEGFLLGSPYSNLVLFDSWKSRFTQRNFWPFFCWDTDELYITINSGWWFGIIFRVPKKNGNFIIPTDELHHFSEGLKHVKTTNRNPMTVLPGRPRVTHR